MFRRKQMEIIIVLAILGVALWWFFIRDEKKSDAEVTSAPYKVPEPAATIPTPLVVEVIPTGTEASSAAPAKAKAPAKPKAPTKAKAPAKAPAKPKAPKA